MDHRSHLARLLGLLVFGLILCSCAPRSILDLRTNATPWIAPDTSAPCPVWRQGETIRLPDILEPDILSAYFRQVDEGMLPLQFDEVSRFDPCGKPQSPPAIGLILSQTPSSNRSQGDPAHAPTLFVPDTFVISLPPETTIQPGPRAKFRVYLDVLAINGAQLPDWQEVGKESGQRFHSRDEAYQWFLKTHWPAGVPRLLTLEISIATMTSRRWQTLQESVLLDMDTHRFQRLETAP